MNITLDITKVFNSAINCDTFYGTPENLVLYLNLLDEIPKILEFEIMNFGLNLKEEFRDTFKSKMPYFKDIVEAFDRHQTTLINNKAKFKITNVKGLEIKFVHKDDKIDSDVYFRSWPYKIKKGDQYFKVMGHWPYSPHFAICYIIADKDAKATISFTENDYVLLDLFGDPTGEFEDEVLNINKHDFGNSIISEIPEKSTTIKGKMFEWDFYSKYFSNRVENSSVASIDEN